MQIKFLPLTSKTKTYLKKREKMYLKQLCIVFTGKYRSLISYDLFTSGFVPQKLLVRLYSKNKREKKNATQAYCNQHNPGCGWNALCKLCCHFLRNMPTQEIIAFLVPSMNTQSYLKGYLSTELFYDWAAIFWELYIWAKVGNFYRHSTHGKHFTPQLKHYCPWEVLKENWLKNM